MLCFLSRFYANIKDIFFLKIPDKLTSYAEADMRDPEQ